MTNFSNFIANGGTGALVGVGGLLHVYEKLIRNINPEVTLLSIPEGVTKVWIGALGAGGSGAMGSMSSGGVLGGGTGGGGGAYGESLITVKGDGNEQISLFVGRGGIGVSTPAGGAEGGRAMPGNDGENTVVRYIDGSNPSVIVCEGAGGGAGQGCINTSNAHVGGAGGELSILPFLHINNAGGAGGGMIGAGGATGGGASGSPLGVGGDGGARTGTTPSDTSTGTGGGGWALGDGGASTDPAPSRFSFPATGGGGIGGDGQVRSNNNSFTDGARGGSWGKDAEELPDDEDSPVRNNYYDVEAAGFDQAPILNVRSLGFGETQPDIYYRGLPVGGPYPYIYHHFTGCGGANRTGFRDGLPGGGGGGSSSGIDRGIGGRGGFGGGGGAGCQGGDVPSFSTHGGGGAGGFGAGGGGTVTARVVTSSDIDEYYNNNAGGNGGGGGALCLRVQNNVARSAHGGDGYVFVAWIIPGTEDT